MTTDLYANWRKRLAGEKVPTFLQAQLADCGYYRKPITKKDPSGNGRNIITGWTPVAYFVDPFLPTVLRGILGDRDMTDAEVAGEEVWSWCCRHPISYETYQAVAERGEPWPETAAAAEMRKVATDLRATANGHPGAIAQAIMWEGKATEVERRVSENQEAPDDAPAKEKTSDDYRAEIETAVKNADALTVNSEAEAAVALGSKNKLAELRLAADKAGRAIYEPLYRAYQKHQKAWAPMVTLADTAEKNLNRKVLTWREAERQRIAREQAEAEAARQAEEEANARAADRAIARGEPEPEPVVTEAPAEIALAPAPVVPTYGTRKLKEEVKTFVTIEDEAKVAAYFRGNAELREVLQRLCESAVKLGQTVPGTTTRQGLV